MPSLVPSHARPPIRRVLRDREISVAGLARELGYSPGVLSLIVNGRTASWPKLRAACSAHLGLPESELFND